MGSPWNEVNQARERLAMCSSMGLSPGDFNPGRDA